LYRRTLVGDVLSFWLRHAIDREHGGFLTALHRDGRVSVRLKGNMWKGPFHLPRMLWYCGRLLDGDAAPASPASGDVREPHRS